MTIIDFNKKFIFIANKKTGSTSLHSYFKKHLSNNFIYSIESINDNPLGKHDSYLDIKNFLSDININIDTFYIFGFVRDPIDRIKSCYKYEKYRNFKYLQNFKLNSDDFNKYITLNLTTHFDFYKN